MLMGTLQVGLHTCADVHTSVGHLFVLMGTLQVGKLLVLMGTLQVGQLLVLMGTLQVGQLLVLMGTLQIVHLPCPTTLHSNAACHRRQLIHEDYPCIYTSIAVYSSPCIKLGAHDNTPRTT